MFSYHSVQLTSIYEYSTKSQLNHLIALYSVRGAAVGGIKTELLVLLIHILMDIVWNLNSCLMFYFPLPFLILNVLQTQDCTVSDPTVNPSSVSFSTRWQNAEVSAVSLFLPRPPLFLWVAVNGIFCFIFVFSSLIILHSSSFTIQIGGDWAVHAKALNANVNMLKNPLMFECATVRLFFFCYSRWWDFCWRHKPFVGWKLNGFRGKLLPTILQWRHLFFFYIYSWKRWYASETANIIQ